METLEQREESVERGDRVGKKCVECVVSFFVYEVNPKVGESHLTILFSPSLSISVRVL